MRYLHVDDGKQITLSLSVTLNNIGVTGETVGLHIRRDSDGFYWNGGGFIATVTALNMAEIDPINFAGKYDYVFTPSGTGASQIANGLLTIHKFITSGVNAQDEYDSLVVSAGALINEESVSNAVWNTQKSIHTVFNSMGEAMALIQSAVGLHRSQMVNDAGNFNKIKRQFYLYDELVVASESQIRKPDETDNSEILNTQAMAGTKKI